MKLYRLLADPAAVTRCHMKAPIDASGSELDARIFTQGQKVAAKLPLSIPLRRLGDEVDFNFGDFDMVVTRAAFNAELEALVGPAIQRIPVTVAGRRGEFEILNVCELVPCIDESRSTFMKWTEADGRPEKVGQFRMITKLRIDPSAAEGQHLFRVAGWPIALVASEEVKALFESRGVTGAVFEAAS